MRAARSHRYRGLGDSPMVVEVQQAEKRATRRFALRLPVSVNYNGNTGPEMSAQTRDVSARGICFYLEAPLATGSALQFTLTLPPGSTQPQRIRVRRKGTGRPREPCVAECE